MKNYYYVHIFSVLASLFLFNSCGKTHKKTTSWLKFGQDPTQRIMVNSPKFDSQKAFDNIDIQVGYGYRVPMSNAHQQTGDWIVARMQGYGMHVIEQSFDAISADYKPIKGRNIIASYNRNSKKRILIATHWDTREIADKDLLFKNKPIPGANDGASGVAVMIEIARLIYENNSKPGIGLDFIFFDAEDGGQPIDSDKKPANQYGGYCMGSEYWALNPHKENYSAYFGILIDMVGAKNATFMKDEASMQIAPNVVSMVWNKAKDLGYESFFIDKRGVSIINDHYPMIEYGHFPVIAITDQRGGDITFFPQHHTTHDDLFVIDEKTLNAVGQTLLQVIYQEPAQMQ